MIAGDSGVTRRTKWAVLLFTVVAAAGVLLWLRSRTPRFDNRTYRIGWMLSSPFQVRGADGKAAGLSVDLVNEAAHRRGIALEWVFWPDSSESALKAKKVDLWPLITVTPERLKMFHISEPYLVHDHCLLVRNDSRFRKIEDLATSTIGISNVSIDRPHLLSVLPGAKPLARPLVATLLQEVCAGSADAAFMDRYTAVSALLNLEGCGDSTLRWIAVPQIRSQLGVGATFEASAVADVIREEIGEMSRSGRLAAVFGQFGFMSGQDVESVEALVGARRRETRLAGVSALFAFLFALTCWQTVRLFRERNRTRQAEAQLRESQERYMQAQKLESIGRLAGGVAHDFNNLLTVINGYSEVVLGKLAEDDPLRSSVQEIHHAGERAADLTQQLLAFGRKQMIQPRAVNLNVVVRNAEKMFRRLLGEDIELTTTLSPNLGLVLVDPGQIHQVLMNLVINARDAMPDGGQLSIGTTVAQIDGQPDVVLTVTDTGQGMDEQTREHIFEPFFTTKGLAKGTGLGLATVYGIVKQSHGWIQVHSEPGKGSSFVVHFPRAVGPEAVIDASPSGNGLLRGSETVLIVEDQEEVRTFVVKALSEYGYQVIDAADGPQALALSESHAGPIHVLLTDVVLPGMNGREVADRITVARPEIAVLFTSGYTADVIAHRGVLDRDVAYIPKPYTAEAIAEKVREKMGNSG
jgi:signal transduction histidine kinase/CheY-like chemotaxis protein